MANGQKGCGRLRKGEDQGGRKRGNFREERDERGRRKEGV
jgi:hypothetical protein